MFNPLTIPELFKDPTLNTVSPPVNPDTRIVAPALYPAVIGFDAIVYITNDPFAVAAVVAIG
jgi:hypothetical protein